MRQRIGVTILFLTLIGMVAGWCSALFAADDSQIFLPFVATAPEPQYKVVATRSFNGQRDLTLIDVRDAVVTPLAVSTNLNENVPQWSPDGSRVVFRRWDGLQSTLWVVGRAGGEPLALSAGLTLSADSRNAFTFDWSPNGQQLTFPHDAQGQQDIFVTASDGSDAAVNVTDSAEFDELAPAWSPDGSQIVYVRQTIPSGTQTEPITSVLRFIQANGFNPQTLYEPAIPRGIFSPTYSPNGMSIAFIDSDLSSDETGQVAIIPSVGGDVRRFDGAFPYTAGRIHWSPDGTSIAFIGEGDNGSRAVFAIRVADGNIEQSLLPPFTDSTISWSPDSQQIVFDAPDGGGRNLFIYELATGLTIPLTQAEAGEEFRQPDWSPVELP